MRRSTLVRSRGGTCSSFTACAAAPGTQRPAGAVDAVRPQHPSLRRQLALSAAASATAGIASPTAARKAREQKKETAQAGKSLHQRQYSHDRRHLRRRRPHQRQPATASRLKAERSRERRRRMTRKPGAISSPSCTTSSNRIRTNSTSCSGNSACWTCSITTIP